jgi:hypothetical protein
LPRCCAVSESRSSRAHMRVGGVVPMVKSAGGDAEYASRLKKSVFGSKASRASPSSQGNGIAGNPDGDSSNCDARDACDTATGKLHSARRANLDPGSVTVLPLTCTGCGAAFEHEAGKRVRRPSKCPACRGGAARDRAGLSADEAADRCSPARAALTAAQRSGAAGGRRDRRHALPR